MQGFRKVVHIDTGIAEPESIPEGRNVFTFVVKFVLNISNNFFYNIFHTDNAGNTAVFINRNGNMHMTAFKFPQ